MQPSVELARLKKSIALADLLFAYGITAEDAAHITPAEWQQVALAARVNPPHSEDTLQMIWAMLCNRRTAPQGGQQEDMKMPTEPYPTLGKEFQHRDAICTKCGQAKRPTRAYMALLKSQDLPYVCQSCRTSSTPPPINLGKLGVI